MNTLYLSIIVISFALILIFPSTAFATMLYNNNEVLKQFNTNSSRMSKLVHDGTILITTQTIKKTEYKLGEKIIVHPKLTNLGNKSVNISYMWHPFFFVINDQNGSAMWANGPSVPMIEYSSNLNQTIKPNMSFTGGIHDVDDPRHPVILDNPGNYSISSVADFYGYEPPRNLVWSEPIKFTVLPETYSVADMNMLPPLQQFLAGIPATSVKCGDGLELLIKTNTGLPVCLKQNSVTKLVERGWAKKAASQIPVVIMPLGFDDIHSGKTYDPSSINVVIDINNTVRWTNKAYSSDTLTSDGFKESNSFGETFGGSTLRPGDTYEFTFTKSGTFGYHGVPHSWNKGKIIVLPPNDSTDISGIKSNNLKSDIISDHVVTVVSIKSIPPVTPGGPTIQLTLKNNNAQSITSLNATLVLYNSYVFDFKDVTQSQPLTSGNSVSETKILIGGGFTTQTQYPLIIRGIVNGIPFSYTENVTIPYTKEIENNYNSNPLGIVALVKYTPYDSCLGLSCPPYTFYLKINAKSTAYLLGYDICGSDLCVKNNTLSILLPMSNTQISNYTFIGISENKKWNYGDMTDMKLEVSPTPNHKDAYFLDMKNSTIVP